VAKAPAGSPAAMVNPIRRVRVPSLSAMLVLKSINATRLTEQTDVAA